jgi:hypothetical protein
MAFGDHHLWMIATAPSWVAQRLKHNCFALIIQPSRHLNCVPNSSEAASEVTMKHIYRIAWAVIRQSHKKEFAISGPRWPVLLTLYSNIDASTSVFCYGWKYDNHWEPIYSSSYSGKTTALCLVLWIIQTSRLSTMIIPIDLSTLTMLMLTVLLKTPDLTHQWRKQRNVIKSRTIR